MNKDNYDLFSTKFQLTVKSLLNFEIKSLLGRVLLNKKPKLDSISSSKKYLNLGCGKNKQNGWINADFYAISSLWKKTESTDWMLDLRYPLNCNDNVWDGVFTEHALEHLYPNDSLKLLREIYRTLKPNCWLRISVPDLGKYIDFYNNKETSNEFTERWENGSEAIRALTQNWGHISVYDDRILKKLLHKAGFKNISKINFNKGLDDKLKIEDPRREWESIYFEAQK